MKIGIESVKDDKYDSTEDTRKHIAMVAKFLKQIADALYYRGKAHDASKLKEPEKAGFDEHTRALKKLKYGSPEYKESLNQLKSVLDHHYSNNRHHPEHFENGIRDMTLVDITEMFADWCAATERHDNGDIFESIKTNKERFDMSDDLIAILENTAKTLMMGKGSKK